MYKAIAKWYKSVEMSLVSKASTISFCFGQTNITTDVKKTSFGTLCAINTWYIRCFGKIKQMMLASISQKNTSSKSTLNINHDMSVQSTELCDLHHHYNFLNPACIQYKSDWNRTKTSDKCASETKHSRDKTRYFPIGSYLCIFSTKIKTTLFINIFLWCICKEKGLLSVCAKNDLKLLVYHVSL